MFIITKRKTGESFLGALDANFHAWKTAERVHEEGGLFVLTNAPMLANGTNKGACRKNKF